MSERIYVGTRVTRLWGLCKQFTESGEQFWEEGEDLRKTFAQAWRDDDAGRPHTPVISSKTSYREYLRSDHWKEMRKKALAAANHCCQVCNTDKSRLDVHHRTYENLWHEPLSNLIVLCEGCHKVFHKMRRLAQ